jgi:hypothetical protein
MYEAEQLGPDTTNRSVDWKAYYGRVSSVNSTHNPARLVMFGHRPPEPSLKPITHGLASGVTSNGLGPVRTVKGFPKGVPGVASVPVIGDAWHGPGALALQSEMACALCPPVSWAQQNAMGPDASCGESKTLSCFTRKRALKPSLRVRLGSATQCDSVLSDLPQPARLGLLAVGGPQAATKRTRTGSVCGEPASTAKPQSTKEVSLNVSGAGSFSTVEISHTLHICWV